MRLKIYTLALIPVILFQGYAVKKNTPRLAEPEGERIGQKGVVSRFPCSFWGIQRRLVLV